MPLLLQSRIHRADLIANPQALYVFGDNEERWGLGGQAREMRGESNAYGVATLKAPGLFWSEHGSARQCAVIDADLEPIILALQFKRLVIFPLDGIGTGLADLANRSPTTFAHLERRVAELKQLGEI